MIDSGLVGREVSRGEKMARRGTDPESYITEYTLVYEDYIDGIASGCEQARLDPWSGP